MARVAKDVRMVVVDTSPRQEAQAQRVLGYDIRRDLPGPARSIRITSLLPRMDVDGLVTEGEFELKKN